MVESHSKDDQGRNFTHLLFSLNHYTTPFQGDFHVVEYLGWETTYTEIVPSDRWLPFAFFMIRSKFKAALILKIVLLMPRLRPKSAEACITGASFFKFSLPVPQELQVCVLKHPSPWNLFSRLILWPLYSQEFCADEKALEIHNDFMKAVDAVHIKYCPEKVLQSIFYQPKSKLWK